MPFTAAIATAKSVLAALKIIALDSSYVQRDK